jgi:hypothetical protein
MADSDPVAKVAWSASKSAAGKWRIVEMPGFPADCPDLVELAYILFEKQGGGEFAFGACTGNIWEASGTEAICIDFSWDGRDEMDQSAVMETPSSSPTAHSMAKSATGMATNSPSLPENGLLQVDN